MKIIFLVLLLTIPTFFRMLRPGIFSMQDFHIFRLYEFDKCVKDLQIPCRWAPDAGFGYGEPVFNFYTQIPYAMGEIFHFLGFQFIDSIKILFILTLVGSAVSMFFLARQIWGNNLSAILSAVVYTYAPYRALDIWVRGALPEAMAFVIFPVIILLINNIFSHKNLRDILLFRQKQTCLLSFSLALLLVTHNLSFLMFLPFLIIWIGFLIFTNKKWRLVLPIFGASILSVFLSAFYLLPIIFESKFIDLNLVTSGYFDFRAHFTTVNQLLISRFWGYGASLFGPKDDLSLSVGQVQWIFPLVTLLWFLFKKQDKQSLSSIKWKELLVLVGIGWLALFLTHNKSTFIWENIPFLSYLQFPWRWLAISTFAFSLASGGVAFLIKKNNGIFISVLIVLAVTLNFSFFKEDIWHKVGDLEQFSGNRWEEQIAASLPDYWPVFAKELPTEPAPKDPIILEGKASGSLVEKTSNKAAYDITVQSDDVKVQFPIVFFPGWKSYIDNQEIDIYPSGIYGLITTKVSGGMHTLTLSFTNTPVRTIGNIVSLLSLLTATILLLKADKRYG